MTEVQLKDNYEASTALTTEESGLTKRLSTLLGRFSGFTAGVSSLVLMAAVNSGDMRSLETELTNFCNNNLSGHHQAFCKKILQLQNLSFMDKLTIVTLAEQHKYDKAALTIINNIADACNKSGFDIDTALTVASLEGAFDLGENHRVNPESTWTDESNNSLFINTISHTHRELVEQYKNIAERITTEEISASVDSENADIEDLSEEAFSMLVEDNFENLRPHIIAELYLSRRFGKEKAQQIINGSSSDYSSLIENISNISSYQATQKTAFGANWHRNINHATNVRLKSLRAQKSSNPVGDTIANLEGRVAEFAGATRVAQTAASKLGTGLQSENIAVPHSILNGEITPANVKQVLQHLVQNLKTVGKDKSYYLFINSPGGNVPAGYTLLKALNRIVNVFGYKNLRVVVTEGSSMALPIAAGFAGKRMIMKDANVVAHAPYFRTPNGDCKLGQSCLTPADQAILDRDVDKMAEIIANRSCVLTKDAASLVLTSEDRKISVAEMRRFKMIDHVVTLSRSGWVVVDQSLNAKCTPLELDDLFALTRREPIITAPRPVPAQRPVPLPFRRTLD